MRRQTARSGIESVAQRNNARPRFISQSQRRASHAATQPKNHNTYHEREHSHKQNDKHNTEPLGPVGIVGLALGIASATVIASLTIDIIAVLQWHHAQQPTDVLLAVGACLLALSIGVRVPHRFAVWICARMWNRFVRGGKATDLSRAALGTLEVDRPLYWVVLAVVSLAAGIVITMWPWGRWMIHGAYAYLQAHFVWSNAPHALLKTLLVFFAGVFPLSLLGLAMSCLHRLSCPFGRWDARATAWLLIGAAGGAFGVAWLLANGRGAQMMMSASVPALVAALLSAGTSPKRRTSADPHHVSRAAEALPIWSDRWPRLLRTAIVTVCVCAVFLLLNWITTTPVDDATAPLRRVALALLSLGIGALVACATHRSWRHTVGTFGIACTIPGVALLLDQPSIISPHGITPIKITVPLVIICTALGFALTAGRLTLLDRVASRSSTGNVMLSRFLVASALTVSVAFPVLARALGVSLCLTSISLALIMLGAILILRESTYSLRARWLRLGAVALLVGAVAFERFT